MVLIVSTSGLCHASLSELPGSVATKRPTTKPAVAAFAFALYLGEGPKRKALHFHTALWVA